MTQPSGESSGEGFGLDTMPDGDVISIDDDPNVQGGIASVFRVSEPTRPELFLPTRQTKFDEEITRKQHAPKTKRARVTREESDSGNDLRMLFRTTPSSVAERDDSSSIDNFGGIDDSELDAAANSDELADDLEALELLFGNKTGGAEG